MLQSPALGGREKVAMNEKDSDLTFEWNHMRCEIRYMNPALTWSSYLFVLRGGGAGQTPQRLACDCVAEKR